MLHLTETHDPAPKSWEVEHPHRVYMSGKRISTVEVHYMSAEEVTNKMREGYTAVTPLLVTRHRCTHNAPVYLELRYSGLMARWE